MLQAKPMPKTDKANKKTSVHTYTELNNHELNGEEFNVSICGQEFKFKFKAVKNEADKVFLGRNFQAEVLLKNTPVKFYISAGEI